MATPTPVCIRFIEEADMPQLMEAERAANEVEFDDPDFDRVKFLNPWVMAAEDVMCIIRQRRSSDKGTYDTRTFVTQIMKKAKGETGQDTEVAWVCGGFALEKHEEHYEFSFFTIHPEAPVEDVFRAMVGNLKSRADRSETRKKVVIYLRDRDEAGLRTFIPLVKGEGFSVKLARDYFGDHDGWCCTYDGAAAKSPGGSGRQKAKA